MTVLHADLLTLNEVAALARASEEWCEAELDKLMTQDPEYRHLQIKHGLYGRMSNACVWLTELGRAVRADDDTRMIALPNWVFCALYDARLENTLK